MYRPEGLWPAWVFVLIGLVGFLIGGFLLPWLLQ